MDDRVWLLVLRVRQDLKLVALQSRRRELSLFMRATLVIRCRTTKGEA
jgi:hypothetical protein